MSPWWLRPAADDQPATQEKKDSPERQRTAHRDSREAAEEVEEPSAKTGKPAGGRRRSRRGRGGGKGRATAVADKPPQASRVVGFVDLASIAAALREAGLEPRSVRAVRDKLSQLGQIGSVRVYGEAGRFVDLVDACREAGYDIIDTVTAAAADRDSILPMALDAMEAGLSKSAFDIVALVSNDPALLPLIDRLRAHDKRVVGIGVATAAGGSLAASFDAFLDIRELAEPVTAEAEDIGIEPSKAPLFSLLVDTIQSLDESGIEVIWGSRLKREMHRRDPDFDEGRHGYSTFSDLLEDADRHRVIQLERDDRSGNYYVAAGARE